MADAPRFKVDENLPEELTELLRASGHDAATVYAQGLRGSEDEPVFAACLREERALITFALGFSDIRRYPPGSHAGLIILRLADQSTPAVLRVLRTVIPLLGREPLTGRLWIVDEHSIRIRGPEH